jgi:uncharacterized protein YoxC
LRGAATASATLAAAPHVSSAGGSGTFSQDKYDKLRKEILGRNPLAAAFLTELNSPMAKRIHDDRERFQAAAETVTSEKNCTLEEILAQLAQLPQEVSGEVDEYVQVKEGQKAGEVLPLQQTLTSTQETVGRLQAEKNQIASDLEEAIKRLREEAAERTRQVDEQIGSKSATIRPTEEEIASIGQKYDGQVADFRVTAGQLNNELGQVLSSAQLFLK